jgi:aldose sugar dehydrogenase
LRRKIGGAPDARDGAALRTSGRLEGLLAFARKHRLFVMATSLFVAFAGVAALGVFAGFQVHRHELNPAYWFFDKVDRKIESTFFKIPPRLNDKDYATALINLRASIGVVNIGRSGRGGPMSENGGGLTSFGNDVLLLPYNGRIYAASDAQHIRETRVAAPDNQRAALLALKNDAQMMASYQFDFSNLRYNDLKAFDTGSERGLIASYTEYHPAKQCFTNTLAVLPIPRSVASIYEVVANPSDWRVIFRTAPCLPLKTDGLAIEGQMAGGRIVFEPPSTIYMTSGDYHFDGMRSEGPPIAQDPTAQYGKILKIDLQSGAGEILSSGHRNPQGIALARNGEVLVAEHGPQGGDELNLVRRGANYGWPVESYGTTYRGTAIPNSVSYGRHDGHERPIYAWVPSVTVASMTRVEGFDDAWNGDFLVGTLIDMSLQRVRIEGGKAIYAERIPIGSRVRYVHQHTDGRLVLWTDNEELIFLKAFPRTNDAFEMEDFLDDADMSEAVKKRVRVAADRCRECHSFQADQNERSPSLDRVFSAEIASTSFAAYSQALRGKSGRWTKERLKEFLTDPQAFAPGTSMPDPQIADAATMDGIIEYLRERRTRF